MRTCLRAATGAATLAVVALCVPSLAASPAAAAPPALAAHTALYTLSFDKAQSDQVTTASGTMSYEVQDACDGGWTVQQRLAITITNRDGQDIQMVSDYATWEAKNGSKLRFRMRQTTDTAVTEITAGDATVSDPSKPGSIHYIEPEDKTVPLRDGTLFPMAHTARLIEGAEEGKKFMAIPLFDGTVDSGGQETSVIVTSWNGPSASPYPALSTLPSGRVHVAFFDHGSTTPDYEVSMRYWENGVADDLNMNFGDFTMNGKLSQFHLNPTPHGC